MLGAIVGDVVGSSREFAPVKSKEFALFEEGSIYTDDTILTLAIASAIVDDIPFAASLKWFANTYVTSYGQDFWDWVAGPSIEPYGSWSNGAAMRVSPAAWLGRDMLHALELARASAAATHNHPEAIRGAEATTLAIYLARAGYEASEIAEIVSAKSGYDLSRSVDQVRQTCVFELASWISIPEALICALKSTSFEDAIRNAVSIGGDADTQAAIAGSIAEALYGIPEHLGDEALSRIPDAARDRLLEVRDKLLPVVAPAAQLDLVPVWDPQSRLDFEKEARALDEASRREFDFYERLEAQFRTTWEMEDRASKEPSMVAKARRWLNGRFRRVDHPAAEIPVEQVPCIDPEITSKLSESKIRWAKEGRFLTGWIAERSSARLPPGQHLTEAWPILDLGYKPYIELASWRLDISGDVNSPRCLSWDEVAALPQTKATSDIHCVTSWSRFDNHWEGVSTKDLIAFVRARQSARFVRLTGCDGYTTNLSIEDFSQSGALLAHSWDGRPLIREHGAPLRLVVPHLYFWKSAKWLKSITFLTADEPGYWETRGYHNVGDPWLEQRYKRSGQTP